MTLVREECCDVEARFREYARVAAVDAFDAAERWFVDPGRWERSEVAAELRVALSLLEMVREVVGDRLTGTCCGVDLVRFGEVLGFVSGGGGSSLPVFGEVFVGSVDSDAGPVRGAGTMD